MFNLLMVTGLGSGRDLASDKKGAFYNTLGEFHKYWNRIDIIVPKIRGHKSGVKVIFGNVFVHISPWPLIFHPIFFLKKGFELHKKYNFNIMTVQEFPPFYNGIGARFLWNKIKVPYVLEVMHVPGYPRSTNLKELFYRFLTGLFIRTDAAKAAAVRVINKSETPEFLKMNGISEDKLLYIPAFYIDLQIFKPMNLEKKYDLIFVGRLETNKGVDLLLEATKFSVFNSQLPIKCLIVGDGPLKKELELKTKSYKLENNIYFHGWANDSKEIAELMNKSKVLVMSSYNEGGPRVILEAMACGVPVLATRVGIVPDVVDDGRTGYIVTWDAKDIASKVQRLLKSDLYRSLEPYCLQMAQQFERSEAIKNYAEKIKQLVIRDPAASISHY